MTFIDLNCDMGELAEHVDGGAQESIMPHLTSVNIACGAHAGDEAMMRATIRQAVRHHLAIGAHPGYADRVHFGRYELHITAAELAQSVNTQDAARLLGDAIPGHWGHDPPPLDSFLGTLTIAEGGLWGELTGISATILRFVIEIMRTPSMRGTPPPTRAYPTALPPLAI